ncbi:MAG TPA: hypothetical protein VMH04_21520 [Candidatus Solibacter sp.]|nr:hypothetical protein [Candidatus Solibacter sp.]
MKKITKLALSVTLIMLIVGAYFVVSASSSHAAGPSKNVNLAGIAKMNVPTNFEGLRSNFITTATGTFVLSGGFTQEDLVNWQCGSTGASTCTLVVNSFATSSGGGVANDDRALCLVLDGEIVGACAYNGYDAADGSYSAISSINNVAGIPVGNHQSFMLFYSTYGTTVYTVTNQYNVYKP